MGLRILLDMDEVITDFIGKACSVWGKDLETEVVPHWTPGHWSCRAALGAALGMAEELPSAAFWDRITEQGEYFWLGLKEHPWAGDLLALVARHSDDWHVVSSPSRCASSHSGKVKWLQRRFGPTFTNFVLTPHKHLFANNSAVLIDDSDANCDAFRKAGGWAVVFPRHNNSLHRLKDDPVKYVAQKLNYLWGEVQNPAPRPRIL